MREYKRLKYKDRIQIATYIGMEIELGIDHVHILIQITLKDAISKVVHTLKGVSSRIIRLEFRKLKKFFWEDGYFLESVVSKSKRPRLLRRGLLLHIILKF